MAVSKDKALELRELARKLFFSTATIDQTLEGATQAQIAFVCEMIALELEVRAQRKREKLFRKAAFPRLKSFEGYDFSQVSFPEDYDGEQLRSLEFLEEAQDFVFYGQTGRGKTHLAIAIGAAAVARSKRVRFFTVAELVMALTRAENAGNLDIMMADIAKSELLILDEFGYVPIDTTGARLLFQVVSSCYEQRSLIVTTNIEFSKWGIVLGDDKLAAAMIDRIVHHGRLIEFGGESKRMGTSLMLGKTK